MPGGHDPRALLVELESGPGLGAGMCQPCSPGSPGTLWDWLGLPWATWAGQSQTSQGHSLSCAVGAMLRSAWMEMGCVCCAKGSWCPLPK